MSSADAKRTVAVIGAGLIGASWTALLSCHRNNDIIVWDPNPNVRAGFLPRLQSFCAQLEDLDQTVICPVRVCATLEEAVESASWNQENGPETLAVKRDLFAQLEPLVDPAAIIASSTSAFR